jgi:hypothetical protein
MTLGLAAPHLAEPTAMTEITLSLGNEATADSL